MQLICPTFSDQQMMPKLFTCKGNNTPPALKFVDVPQHSASLTLIMHDPDAPGGDFTHWLMWNIPATTTLIDEGQVPLGAMQGVNDFGNTNYDGPCPPTGTHRYIFSLFALDTSLNIASSTNRHQLLAKIETHILADATLTGLFGSDSH